MPTILLVSRPVGAHAVQAYSAHCDVALRRHFQTLAQGAVLSPSAKTVDQRTCTLPCCTTRFGISVFVRQVSVFTLPGFAGIPLTMSGGAACPSPLSSTTSRLCSPTKASHRSSYAMPRRAISFEQYSAQRRRPREHRAAWSRGLRVRRHSRTLAHAGVVSGWPSLAGQESPVWNRRPRDRCGRGQPDC